MMRFSVVLQTRLAVSALGLMLVAVTPLRAQDPQEGEAKLAIAESVIAREEAASERAFDPSFRAKAKEALAALPLAAHEVQTGENGLGLNSLGDSQADLVYTPITPCRIIDTRIVGGVLAVGTPRSFLVTGTDYSAQGGKATGCGVPFGPATAAVINFVAVDAAGRGNLQVTPYGTAMPLASIINFTAGFNIANGPSVALCDPSATTCTKDITIQANNSTAHLVADVQGYYQRVATEDLGGDITAVNTPAGGGLQGGVASGDANLALLTCGSGQVLKSDGSTWSCATDSDTDTGVNAVVGGGGVTGSIAARTLTLGSSATAANTAGAIVARDASGNFSAGSIGLAGNLGLPNTTSGSVGVLTMGGSRFLHNFGTSNTFVGAGAGNFTLTGTGNSAFGFQAFALSTTGSANAAFGYYALRANTTGTFNTALGTQALMWNTTGNRNTAMGLSALQSNAVASENSAFGYVALTANTTGEYNSAFGSGALTASTTASYNSAFGYQALDANTTGLYNTAVGYQALGATTDGDHNAAVGSLALLTNTTGSDNSAFGDMALMSNTTASANSAFGYQALGANTTGTYNSAFGVNALFNNTEGHYNSALGDMALQSNTTASYNSAFGYQALYQLSSGSRNIAVGTAAGTDLTIGNYDIYIGNPGVSSESNTIRIGDSNQTATFIAGIYNGTVSERAVYVNSSGQLGTISSSRRYKEQIADMSGESDVLMKLRPVSFYYRPELDATHLRQYGLVAEEVAEVARGLVDYDKDDAPQTVRYHFVNAMLLNEVQKQRATIERQESKMQDLEERLARLEAALAADR